MAHLVEGAVVSQLVVSRARSGSEERVQHLHEDLGGDEFCLPAAPELQLVPVSLVAVQHLVELASDLRDSLGDVVAFGLHLLNAVGQVGDVLVMDRILPRQGLELDLHYIGFRAEPVDLSVQATHLVHLARQVAHQCVRLALEIFAGKCRMVKVSDGMRNMTLVLGDVL